MGGAVPPPTPGAERKKKEEKSTFQPVSPYQTTYSPVNEKR